MELLVERYNYTAAVQNTLSSEPSSQYPQKSSKKSTNQKSRKSRANAHARETEIQEAEVNQIQNGGDKEGETGREE